MREGTTSPRGLLGIVVQRRRPAPSPGRDAKKRLLGSVVVRETCSDQEVGMLGRERENKRDVKRRGNEVGKSSVGKVDYKSQSASRWGLS